MADVPLVNNPMTAVADTIIGGTVTGGVAAPTRLKNNYSAAVAPAVTNDSSQGYAIGSRWINTTADKEYVALDVSVGAAVWTETTGGGASGPSLVGLGTPIKRTAGNFTCNQTTWDELAAETGGPGTGGFDFDFTGIAAGDVAEFSINGGWQSAAVVGCLDIATMVSGSPVNFFGTAVPPSTGQGVHGWLGNTGIYFPFAGSAYYVIQAGDLSAGALKLRPYMITLSASNKVLYANTTQPLMLMARVWRP